MNPYDLSDRKFRRNSDPYDCGATADELNEVVSKAKKRMAKWPKWERDLHKWNDELLKRLQREE